MKKEENVLELFFNEPTKHWHFEEILKEAKISRPQASQWLKKFQKDGFVKRNKQRGKMPYYLGDFYNPSYQSKKRVYALEQLEKSGFFSHLLSLEKAKTIIIFGSFIRSDWYKESDIDLFIYGSDEDLNLGKYERELSREIQLFTVKDKKELSKFSIGLIENIIKGLRIKGSLDFIEVNIRGIQNSKGNLN